MTAPLQVFVRRDEFWGFMWGSVGAFLAVPMTVATMIICAEFEQLRPLAFGRQTFRIVGEDEADPRNGSISYVSPVARALIGRTSPAPGKPTILSRTLPRRESAACR